MKSTEDIAPCIKCGRQPHIVNRLGTYYVQCDCCKHDPFAFCGLRPCGAIVQWNYENRPINMPGRKGNKDDLQY